MCLHRGRSCAEASHITSQSHRQTLAGTVFQINVYCCSALNVTGLHAMLCYVSQFLLLQS